VSIQRVTSRRNPLVARYRAASRGDADHLLLDGAHLVTEALEARIKILEAAVASDVLQRADLAALLARLEQAGVEIVGASTTVMEVVSPVRSPSPIVAIAERPANDIDRLYGTSRPMVIIASDVQDPGNVGAIVRVAEAGGATGVVLTGACADPFGWKALRGSMGSALRVPIAVRQDVDQVVAEARRHGCRIVATTPRGGRSLFELDLVRPTVALIGGEGRGLSPALVAAADEPVTIPMQPPVESLNAAVAAALIVYEALRQRHEEDHHRGTEAQRR
jgi:TrmH family RNA methyltransferase